MVPPEVAFHGQPLTPEDAAGAVLRRLLLDPAYDVLTVAVAWARFRGLSRLRDELAAFTARGGRSTIILGIDEGGATRPGLLLAAELFTDAFAFHDEGPGTFHPKVYLFRGSARASLFVGSSNATPGGFFANVEASLEATFALPGEREHPALVDAIRYLDRLRKQPDACLKLTPELVDRLVANPRYQVSGVERGRGDQAHAVAAGIDPADLDEEPDDTASGERLFGTATGFETQLPPLDAAARARQVQLEVEDSEADSEPPGPPPTRTVVVTWSKELRHADAQQPEDRTRTNPTGVLRLAAASEPIDRNTFFRHELFGPASWRPGTNSRGKPIEIANVPFHVWIAGTSHGTITLRLTHAPHREAKQGNVPTNLHWGPTLGPLLRATSYYQHTVTLSRLSDGTYELIIN
jgi:hypothetical protein